MHLKTMVRKTLDKFERLKTETRVNEDCHFCYEVDGRLGSCDECKLAKRLVHKRIPNRDDFGCLLTTFNRAQISKYLKLGTSRACWIAPSSMRSYNWLNGFVDFLQEWLDELEGRSNDS